MNSFRLIIFALTATNFLVNTHRSLAGSAMPDTFGIETIAEQAGIISLSEIDSLYAPELIKYYYSKKKNSVINISIAFLIIASCFTVSYFLWRLYLKKYKATAVPKLCLRAKIAIASCFFAPLATWLCADYLWFVASENVLRPLANNNPAAMLGLINPAFLTLLAGLICSISILSQGKNKPAGGNNKADGVTAISLMVLTGFACFLFDFCFFIPFSFLAAH